MTMTGKTRYKAPTLDFYPDNFSFKKAHNSISTFKTDIVVKWA